MADEQDWTPKFTYNQPPTSGAYATDEGWVVDDADGNPEILIAIRGLATRTEAGVANIISITPPADGWFVETDNMDFVVRFNEKVDVDTGGGTPRLVLTLATGGTKYAPYISGTGTTDLTFRYTVEDSVEDKDGVALTDDIDLNSGAITDDIGGATTDVTFTAADLVTLTGVLVDSIEPTISSVSATAGDYDTGETLPITVTFDEAVLVDTTGGTPTIPVFANDGTTPLTNTSATYASGSGTTDLVFNYTVDVADSEATAVKAGADVSLNSGTITDLAGNNATLTVAQATLTSVTLNTLPTISSVTAPSGNVNTGENIVITVVFSEPVDVVTTGGTPTIPVFANDGTTPLTNTSASYVSGTGTTDLVFHYLVDAGDTEATAVKAGADIALNSGTIKDGGGNNATVTFAQATLTGVTTNQ